MYDLGELPFVLEVADDFSADDESLEVKFVFQRIYVPDKPKQFAELIGDWEGELYQQNLIAYIDAVIEWEDDRTAVVWIDLGDAENATMIESSLRAFLIKVHEKFLALERVCLSAGDQ